MSGARTNRPTRFSDDETQAVQDVANRDGISWAEALRRMVGYSAIYMPEGWHTGQEARRRRGKEGQL